MVFVYLFFFFFKQKTAYEMRISDWSSDVCSSDLLEFERGGGAPSVRSRVALERFKNVLRNEVGDSHGSRLIDEKDRQFRLGELEARVMALEALDMRQIGRASGRERVWQYV